MGKAEALLARAGEPAPSARKDFVVQSKPDDGQAVKNVRRSFLIEVKNQSAFPTRSRESVISGVGYNLKVEISRLAERFRQLGHERVAVPLDLVGRHMENTVRDALAEGLGVRPGLPLLRDLCPVFPERVPAAWQQYWKKLFLTVRPAALILTNDFHVQSLYGYCFQNGLSIPRDVSVVCLENTEHLEWSQPVPSRMSFPIHAATAYFKKWIRGGCRPMGMKFLPLDCIEAATIAHPPVR